MNDFSKEIKWKSTPTGAEARKDLLVASIEAEPMTNKVSKDESPLNPFGTRYLWPVNLSGKAFCSELQWLKIQLVPAECLIYYQGTELTNQMRTY